MSERDDWKEYLRMGVAPYVDAIYEVGLRLRVIRTSGSTASDPAAGGIKHFLGQTAADGWPIDGD